MKLPLELRHENGRAIEICRADGALLWRYVYAPDSLSKEAPRPYAHPIHSLAGDVLTNFRPNDHPWHQGLNFTITSVSGVNFWGGPTYKAAGGYQWRDNHGAQRHRYWAAMMPDHLEHQLDWCEISSGRRLLQEQRTLRTEVTENEWSLQWKSDLLNVAGKELRLGNYHALEQLKGSHYTGLQFRGSRELLDDHGDAEIGIFAEGGLAGEDAVHGAVANWMEWRVQHDGSQRRTSIRFTREGGAIPWFVRRKNPLAAIPFHKDEPVSLPIGGRLTLDHTITFKNLA